jgi:hypothetical protein
MIALAISLVAGLAALAACFAYLLDCARLQPCQAEQKIIEKARAIQRAIL